MNLNVALFQYPPWVAWNGTSYWLSNIGQTFNFQYPPPVACDRTPVDVLYPAYTSGMFQCPATGRWR